MAFEDEPHILRIISALYSRAPGKAAVLVGAGFSFNAVPLRGSHTAMPGWAALVERMILDLNPGDHLAAVERRDWLRGQAGATSAALRIAQEYESEFGRDGLDRLISESVPDVAFGPGDHHRLLLQLPWADVLTTNWDTLLERAAREVDDRVYSLVQTVADISGTPGPRIVKLHGSLPSHRPFIFTEEDFRTYPVDFAPFVNLARQATMENVLVLLGFSGDDPNFLYWSGWVRDQLGDNAPAIYLVGALDLTAPQRKMLEKRKVRPIDLARLADYRTWPEQDRKAKALRWFLERLAAARPYPRIRWPSAPAEGPGRLLMVERKPDPRAPRPFPRGMSSEDWTVERIREEIIPTLTHNRCVYPGWVAAGHTTRNQIWAFLRFAIPEANKAMADLDPELALPLAFELNWLCEIAMIPLFSDLEEPISQLLGALEWKSLRPSAREQLVALGFALLRRSRETSEPEPFAKWTVWLQAHAVRADDQSRLHYEECLYARDTFDYDRLDALLNDWRPDGDPFWQVRKAALLAENDRADEGRRLSKDALAAVRQRSDKDREDIGSWSRESFALLLRWSCVASEIQGWRENQVERDEFIERMLVLAGRGCDANEEFDWIKAEMEHAPPPLGRVRERILGFDVGSVSHRSNVFASAPIIKRIGALQALRFLDEIGAPARIAPVTVATNILSGAADWLLTLDTARAIPALVRAADHKAVDTVLTRDAVMALEDGEADLWGGRLLTGVRALAKRVATPAMVRSAEGRLNVALEALSRLVVLRRQFAAEALEVALILSETMGRRSRSSLQNLFRRAFKALPEEQRKPYVIRILMTDPPPESEASSDPAQAILSSHVALTPDPEFEPVVRRLAEAMRDPERRFMATLRMQRLYSAGALDAAGIEAYRDALWAPEYVANGLPTQTPLRSWAIAEIDPPAGADPVSAVRAKLVSISTLDDQNIAGEIQGALSTLGPRLRLRVNELTALLKLFLEKASRPVETDDPLGFFDPSDGMDVDFWRAFSAVLQLAVPYRTVQPMIQEFFGGPHPKEAAIGVAWLLRAGLTTADRAGAALASALDGEGDAPICAAYGMINWIREAPNVAMPDRLWSVLVDAVTSRAPEALVSAMEFLSLAYRVHADRVPVTMDERLHRALRGLLKATDPAEDRSAFLFDPGLARTRAARLVKAMSQAGRGESELDQAWREAAKAQTFPEIDEFNSDEDDDV